jgi:hypothetical protein
VVVGQEVDTTLPVLRQEQRGSVVVLVLSSQAREVVMERLTQEVEAVVVDREQVVLEAMAGQGSSPLVFLQRHLLFRPS